MSNHAEHRKAAQASHDKTLKTMLGESEHYTDEKMSAHKHEAAHLKPEQVAKIADKVVKEDIKGAPTKARMDRAARKKGGKAGKGDVNIIIATGAGKPGMGSPGAPMAPMAPPPRPPVVPPPMPPMPAQGAPMGAGMPPSGLAPQGPMAGPGMSPPPRKKGGRTEEHEMKYGAGEGLGRLEKIAKYGAKP